MIQIDWSKAPKGFPLWIEGVGEHARWSGWCRDAGEVFLGKGGGQFRSSREGQFFTVHRKPEEAGEHSYSKDQGCPEFGEEFEPTWNGGGLPPVGTVCEFCRFPEKCGAKWSTVAIVAHWQEGLGAPVAIFMSTGFAPQADQAIADRFRPIRTAEQIAAEDRLATIAKMSSDAQLDFSAGELLSSREYVECAISALYDAGYRKQVTE